MKINPAQVDAVTHIVETGQTLLIGAMGAGKSIIALTAMDECLQAGHNKRFLVVAPKKVCEQVWLQEICKWGLFRLNAVVCTGSPALRLRGLNSSANVCVINFENLAWLFSDPAHFDSFDGLVIDESTKLKAGGKAFKAIRRHIGQFSTRLCLTGTPVEEDFTGLFYQAMLVDHGAAYGKNKSAWLEKYFVQADYRGYQHSLIAADTLLAPFQDNIISLPSYSAELPALTETIVLIPGCRTTEYDELRRDMATGEVSAANAAVLTNKLQQAACGFLYSDSGETLHIHQHKIDWLTAQPRPAWRVIAYQYKEELTRLAAAFPDAYVIDQLAEWRTKGGDLLIHPRSAGHGLDLTAASTLVFMSPVWSRDLTRQTIARIWRRGQAADCSVDILVGEGTIEQDIVTRERGKASYHALLLANLAV